MNLKPNETMEDIEFKLFGLPTLDRKDSAAIPCLCLYLLIQMATRTSVV